MPGRAPDQPPSYWPPQPEDKRAKLERESGKKVYNWEPRYNSDIAIELDGCIIYGVPEYIEQESDSQGKILLALLGEILTLRDRLDRLESAAARGELKSQVQAMKDAAVLSALKENMDNKNTE